MGLFLCTLLILCAVAYFGRHGNISRMDERIRVYDVDSGSDNINPEVVDQ